MATQTYFQLSFDADRAPKGTIKPESHIFKSIKKAAKYVKKVLAMSLEWFDISQYEGDIEDPNDFDVRLGGCNLNDAVKANYEEVVGINII